MTLEIDQIEDDARKQTGLDETGGDHYREGLERLVASMNGEGTLTAMGEAMQQMRLSMLLAARLGVEETYRLHPEIDDQVIEGPVFVIGLPRTGTTALSQLVAADPQFRSLRTWESAAPVPPPESATEHSDPRIAATEGGLAMMNEAFPLMQTMHHSEATTATECQDLMGMSFRTAHFDGFARVPSYMAWVVDTDMGETYRYHRRVLRLLQWHCPPHLWHLKTPVHMFALDSLVEAYPNARFLWSHRDPTKVLGSVCSLIHYTRSWSSERDDAIELGAEQLEPVVGCASSGPWSSWERVGDERFADVSFGDLQTDPTGGAREGCALESRSASPSTNGLSSAAGRHGRGSQGGPEPTDPVPTGPTAMRCPISDSSLIRSGSALPRTTPPSTSKPEPLRGRGHRAQERQT